MGVSFGRSRVADLSFQVFARAIHPDWFSVREHRRLTRTGWDADVRLIEGGHAVVWSSGPCRVSEVLCGPETPLPEPGLMFHSPVVRERSIELHPSLRVDYQGCIETERVPEEVFRHLCEEMVLDARRGGLFHRFERTNRLAPPPLSLLTIEPRPRGLSVQAIHTFPDECAVVRSQSLFEIADDDAG